MAIRDCAGREKLWENFHRVGEIEPPYGILFGCLVYVRVLPVIARSAWEVKEGKDVRFDLRQTLPSPP
jgi:hypothetical protein